MNGWTTACAEFSASVDFGSIPGGEAVSQEAGGELEICGWLPVILYQSCPDERTDRLVAEKVRQVNGASFVLALSGRVGDRQWGFACDPIHPGRVFCGALARVADKHEGVGRYATRSGRRSLPTGAVGVGDRVQINGRYRGEAAQCKVTGSTGVALDDQCDIDGFP